MYIKSKVFCISYSQSDIYSRTSKSISVGELQEESNLIYIYHWFNTTDSMEDKK